MEVDGLELNDIRNEDINTTCLKMQKPARILHFSDGVMEQYSDSEDELDSAIKCPEELINEKDLPWGPYMRLKANKLGNSVLSGIDFLGGGLASFLGITGSEDKLAAAHRAIMMKENTDEENCSTWTPARSNVVVSAEVISSPRADSKMN